MMKKIMLLGGNYFQMTATKAAKALGCHVISVDYLPDNPAHKFADEYHNVSTTDRNAVLNLAKQLHIDGIVSYASDVSAPTAAYVAEKLGLPTNPLSAVEILTNKRSFRLFLQQNGFHCPAGRVFDNCSDAKKYFEGLSGTAILKPTDSSGSKGVHKVCSSQEFEAAWKDAQKYSRNHRILVEEFIEKDGYEIDADSFWIKDHFAYFGVMDQHNDLLCNPYVPVGLSGPSVLSLLRQQQAKKELTRMMQLLEMRIGACNIEYIFNKKGDLYILEIGPRNGGNLITDTIKYGCGIDLARYTILAALGDTCEDLVETGFHACVSSYIIHTSVGGVYQNIWIDEKIKKNILRLDLFVHPGTVIQKFDNAGCAIGAAIIQFNNQREMCEKMDHMEKYIKVITV